jgi:putative GTP pyrophosphokinase
MTTDPRLQLFQKKKYELEAKRVQIVREVTRALESSGVGYQGITSRVKGEESLARKLARPDKTYKTLWNVTDLVGIRVVTYFEDSIEEIASLVERSFGIDYQNSTNKMNAAEHDRFGYRSLHYICYLKDDPEFRFEIQIRTILQHAWAEIEHDLGYKAGDLASQRIRRRFSRIAGLLEIADQEFVSIKRELDEYVTSVRENASAVELDAISILTLLERPEVASADQWIAELLGVKLSAEPFYPYYLVRMLQAAGLRGVRETIESMTAHRAQIEQSAKCYFEIIDELWGIRFESTTALPRGYSLVLLSHVLILASEPLALNKVRRLAEMYRTIDQAHGSITPLDIANRFVDKLTIV